MSEPIKMIATDFDGTLIQEGSSWINPEYYEVIRKLTAQGIIFVGASGRQYQSMRYLFEPVADQMVFISENGTKIMWKEECLFYQDLDVSLARRIVAFLKEQENVIITVSHPDGMFVQNPDPVIFKWLTQGYHNQAFITDHVEDYCTKTNKMSIYCSKGIEALLEKAKKQFGDEAYVTQAGASWIDFMKKGVDKGTGLELVQQYFGILPQETMSFGDNMNDLGLLIHAKESYAVETALPEVKKAARHICASYKEDGVLRILKNLLDVYGIEGT